MSKAAAAAFSLSAIFTVSGYILNSEHQHITPEGDTYQLDNSRKGQDMIILHSEADKKSYNIPISQDKDGQLTASFKKNGIQYTAKLPTSEQEELIFESDYMWQQAHFTKYSIHVPYEEHQPD